ncbi:D-hexose-6-phosphate mutarotase [Biostraticola tofi]|uniref:Putative glucose-6-phosphate 1-epimerase n=1 Tax=Biostraticola tofi TaxID=466109 RepID=A0A4R3Z465_9GAMM|nr:D-hexose-6-phosphate mutarotase [Biostraticola tofi]TCV99952.1 glucose-6-phosphate 1-epimerase [Biostraticola tofi]
MSENLFALPIKETLSPSVTLRQIDQLPVIIVKNDSVQAAITLQGAHLLAWQPKGEQPVLWLSDSSAFCEGVAIRGGVPICWPWFGKVASPNHGFARILPWELTAHQEHEGEVSLTLTLRDSAQTEQYWPNSFTLNAHFKLGKTCTVQLEAEGDYQTTAALHSYFTIGNINQVSVSGLGENYIDKVNGGATARQTGHVTFTGEVDRVYTQPEDISVIHDEVLGRTITLHHDHISDVVAWNPGAALARTMTDVTDEGYLTYVCVETARVSQPLVATPGEKATLAVTLSVSPS